MAGLAVILVARLAVLTGFLVILSVLLPGDTPAFYGMMALAYTITIPYALWLKQQARAAEHLHLQFAVDLVVVTGLVYFTGGPESELALLYPLVILGAGIVAGPRRALQITLLCVVLYVLLAQLLWEGVLVGPDGVALVRPPWREAAGLVVLRVGVFALFGAASSYLSQRCTYVDRNLARFRELAEVVFRHLPAGLLVVDEQDRVCLANDRVAAMLDALPGDLEGRPLDALLQNGDPSEEDDWGDGSTARWLVRSNGGRLPVHVEVSALDWSPRLLNPGAEGGPRHIRIMAVSDFSRLLELQRGMKEAVRARTIGAMASEIAHEIRNPIAAISGSVQLLDKLEKRSERGDLRSDQLLAAEKGMLYECIVSEADRLGRAIERFVDYSEFSVDKLRDLIAMPEIHTQDQSDVQAITQTNHSV